MPSSSRSGVVQRLWAAAGFDEAGQTDAELLTQFLSQQNEDALAILVERHAPLVWGVCQRILRNPHDTEDAFQATFLVLVQKAETVLPREMLANWLYGVARQTALRLKTTNAKRGWREMQMDIMPEAAVVEDRDEELLSLLDEELSRLPQRHRALIVFCDLEGRTRKEVARQLGCPEGTVASGLVRARELLAKRLTRRGLAVTGASLAATLSHSMAIADLTATAVTSTINVASLLTAGKAAGVISGPVATLTQGVLKTMFLKKILTATMAVLALSVAVIIGGNLAVGQTEGKPVIGKDVKLPFAEKPKELVANREKQKKEPAVAWGKEVGGLQLGLSLVPGDKTAYRPGETMEFTVHVRNVGKDKITLGEGSSESTPKITNTRGEAVSFTKPALLFHYSNPPAKTTFQPGETVGLYRRTVFLESEGEGQVEPKEHPNMPAIRTGAGKYKIAFEERVQAKLALETGEVEFEVKTDGAQVPQDKKEPFTAWGKEVGGLQAGLGFKVGEKRTYHHGESVTLVVRVRNVSKETVTFDYLGKYFAEHPYKVTDAEGQAVPVQAVTTFGIHIPQEVKLEPGKETTLRELTIELRQPKQDAQNFFNVLHGTGRFRLSYDPVLGNTSSGKIKLDPALATLATGKLELEIAKLELPEAQPKAKSEPFTLKNVTIDEVDEKAGVISVSFGNKDKPTKLVNVPLDKGVKVMASHVKPGIGNNFPFEWKRVVELKGKFVSLRLAPSADGLVVVSIASGND